MNQGTINIYLGFEPLHVGVGVGGEIGMEHGRLVEEPGGVHGALEGEDDHGGVPGSGLVPAHEAGMGLGQPHQALAMG